VIHNCAPVAATIRTGLKIGKPQGFSLSLVAPAYPRGWSDRRPSPCKIPNLLHGGVPPFPTAMSNVPIDKTYNASVRVQVNAAGDVTDAALVASSRSRTFDDALLRAAKSEYYPLTESSGFKPVRPSDAPLSWNASHGSSTYLECRPFPTQYVWNTTFDQLVPTGFPGSTANITSLRAP
jgi:TonB family protein